MALLRTSGRSTKEMHAGGMKFTAAFQLVRQTSFFFRKINCEMYNAVCFLNNSWKTETSVPIYMFILCGIESLLWFTINSQQTFSLNLNSMQQSLDRCMCLHKDAQYPSLFFKKNLWQNAVHCKQDTWISKQTWISQSHIGNHIHCNIGHNIPLKKRKCTLHVTHSYGSGQPRLTSILRISYWPVLRLWSAYWSDYQCLRLFTVTYR